MGVGEFIGWRALAGEDTEGALYTMGLTDEPVVRCRDCMHGRGEGRECALFASWRPVCGGDEYESALAEVSPDGYCKWGERR